MIQKMRKIAIFWAQKLLKMTFYTWITAFPIASPLSTWWTTKCGYGTIIKLNARWALHVYPVLKAQSHEKKVRKDLEKQFFGLQKITMSPIIAAIASRLLKMLQNSRTLSKKFRSLSAKFFHTYFSCNLPKTGMNENTTIFSLLLNFVQ